MHRHTDTWRGGEAFVASSCACPSVILAPSSPTRSSLCLSTTCPRVTMMDGWIGSGGIYFSFFIFHFAPHLEFIV